MVDEFSSFARMPQPVIKPEDVGRIAREALVLQRTARPQITWRSDIPDRGPVAPCDRRLLSQALTNLLQNAADAVAMREGAGQIGLDVCVQPVTTVSHHRDRRWHRVAAGGSRAADGALCDAQAEGNWIGTGIVKKIMEDHGGRLTLDDRPDGPGAVAALVLPAEGVGWRMTS